MSTDRGNPLDLAILGNLPVGPALDEQIKKLHKRVIQADSARQAWSQKQEKLIRQRRGIRQPRSFPWPGSNNHNWPLTDGIIRRWKPNIAALVTQSDPVTYFFPTKTEAVAAAPIAQAYFHWRFWSIGGIHTKALELLDIIGQHGIAYTRQGWDYQTTKSCRIVQIASLFPQGVDAAVQQFNAQATQMEQQTQQAVAAGQAPPEALQQVPQQVDAETLVRQMLTDEYILNAKEPMEAQQLDVAVKAVLQGATHVKFYYTIVKCDKPSWQIINPMDVTIPPRCTDTEQADFIAVRHQVSADMLRKMGVDGRVDPRKAEEVAAQLERKTTDDPDYMSDFGDMAAPWRSQIRMVLDQADGVNRGDVEEPSQTILLEIYCKLDINGDKLLEKCIMWYHPETHTVLSLVPYPYPFDEWPITRFEFEHTSSRPYAPRGIAEMSSTFQATVNKLHNARLDAAQITLSPMFQMRASATDANRNIKFMPGQIIPVTTVGDIAPIPLDTHGLLQNLNEENLTKQMAEQYIGIFDPGVLAQNTQERRTATEIQAVTEQSQSIFGQDASLFQASMGKVYRQLWHLIQEFDPDELSFRITGEQTPRLAKKHEICYDYDIVPAGTPANTNHNLAARRALEMIQLFGPDMTGLINKFELFKRYFDTSDHNLAKLILRTPDQAALVQQMQQVVAQSGQQPAPPP